MLPESENIGFTVSRLCYCSGICIWRQSQHFPDWVPSPELREINDRFTSRLSSPAERLAGEIRVSDRFLWNANGFLSYQGIAAAAVANKKDFVEREDYLRTLFLGQKPD